MIGDLAVTETPHESFLQHLILWIGTPRGEIEDRKAGSILYDYLHEKLTRSTASELEAHLRRDLEESIPELKDLVIESLRYYNRRFSYRIFDTNPYTGAKWKPPDLLQTKIGAYFYKSAYGGFNSDVMYVIVYYRKRYPQSKACVV